MDIWNDEFIAGHPISRVKKFLKRGETEMLSASILASYLKVNTIDSKKVLNELKELGYVEQINDINWSNTIRGKLLIENNVKRVMSKNVAKIRMSQILKRVDKVNRDALFLHSITDIKLLIDYSITTSNIRYLNLAIKLAQKEKDESIYQDLLADRCRKSKKRFSNYLQYYLHPQYMVLDYLKGSQHNIHAGIDNSILFPDPELVINLYQTDSEGKITKMTKDEIADYLK